MAGIRGTNQEKQSFVNSLLSLWNNNPVAGISIVPPGVPNTACLTSATYTHQSKVNDFGRRSTRHNGCADGTKLNGHGSRLNKWSSDKRLHNTNELTSSLGHASNNSLHQRCDVDAKDDGTLPSYEECETLLPPSYQSLPAQQR